MTETVERPVDEEMPQTSQQADYFGFESIHTFTLPDGSSWIKFRTLNEGQKAEWEKATQGDVVFERSSGNARMKMRSVEARHQLITLACVEWNLKRNGKDVPISHGLRDFLKYADPKLVLDLERAIRKENPFLMTDMSVEEIDKAIEELQEQREIALERERGEGNSPSRQGDTPED